MLDTSIDVSPAVSVSWGCVSDASVAALDFFFLPWPNGLGPDALRIFLRCFLAFRYLCFALVLGLAAAFSGPLPATALIAAVGPTKRAVDVEGSTALTQRLRLSPAHEPRGYPAIMSNTSRVMSNREYEKFMKEKKHEAFKKCDPIVQGSYQGVLTSRICRVLTQSSIFRGMGVSQAEQGHV